MSLNQAVETAGESLKQHLWRHSPTPPSSLPARPLSPTMTFPVFKTTQFYLHDCNLPIFFHCRKLTFLWFTKTTWGVHEATQNDGCWHQVISTAKNYLGKRKSYPHPCLAKGEDQQQLTFWQSDLISHELTLVLFVLLNNARRLQGWIYCASTKPLWAKLTTTATEKENHTHTKKRQTVLLLVSAHRNTMFQPCTECC